jgi:hypothetical protein
MVLAAQLRSMTEIGRCSVDTGIKKGRRSVGAIIKDCPGSSGLSHSEVAVPVMMTGGWDRSIHWLVLAAFTSLSTCASTRWLVGICGTVPSWWGL